jgi:hypothetical protein
MHNVTSKIRNLSVKSVKTAAARNLAKTANLAVKTLKNKEAVQSAIGTAKFIASAHI